MGRSILIGNPARQRRGPLSNRQNFLLVVSAGEQIQLHPELPTTAQLDVDLSQKLGVE
jgi:hypothetical protein